MSAIAIIPARGGSRRIPRKNIREFFGKPIIAYSIETALATGLFECVIVTTDDEEIAIVAQRYGAATVGRPAELAADEIGTQEVMRWALEQLGNQPQDYACCIYPCAPLMLESDLWAGWNAIQREQTDYCYSVGCDPFRDAGAWYWGKVSAFTAGLPLDQDGQWVMKVVIPNHRICDINTEEDWQRACRLYAEMVGRKAL